MMKITRWVAALIPYHFISYADFQTPKWHSMMPFCSPTWRCRDLWRMQLRQTQRLCGGKDGGLLLSLSKLAEHC